MIITTEDLNGSTKKYAATLKVMNAYVQGYQVNRGRFPPQITVNNDQFKTIVDQWRTDPRNKHDKPRLDKERLTVTHKGIHVRPVEPSKLPYFFDKQR